MDQLLAIADVEKLCPPRLPGSVCQGAVFLYILSRIDPENPGYWVVGSLFPGNESRIVRRDEILVLSASTGGGHDMRAFALRDWWHQEGGECEVFHPLESTFGVTG